MSYHNNNQSPIFSAAAGLGSVGGPLYVDGRPYNRPLTIQHMAGLSTRGGCSGCGSPDGLGEYFAPNGRLRAFRDGSLGEYFAPNGRLRAFRDGSLGEYFAANGLGATGGTVLDLNDEATLTEVKQYIGGLATAAGTGSSAEMSTGPGYTSSDADVLVRALGNIFGEGAAYMTMTGADGLPYPTGKTIISTLERVYAVLPEGGGAEVFNTLFPLLSAWTTALYGANAKGGIPMPLMQWTDFGTVITPAVAGGPALSTPAKVGIGVGTIALGAAALVAGYFIVKRMRKA